MTKTTEMKFRELLLLNDEGGKVARSIESYAKKLQPHAESMFDLTKESINKIYDYVMNK